MTLVTPLSSYTFINLFIHSLIQQISNIYGQTLGGDKEQQSVLKIQPEDVTCLTQDNVG